MTAAQSLHWMEADSTEAEIARVLRPGDVFAQLDFKWPLIGDWETEHAIHASHQRCVKLVKNRG